MWIRALDHFEFAHFGGDVETGAQVAEGGKAPGRIDGFAHVKPLPQACFALPFS